MLIRELLVGIGLQFDEKGLKNVEAKLGTLKRAAQGLAVLFAGGAVYTALSGFVEDVTRIADETGKLAESFGLSTDSMQKLSYAAQISNVGVEGLRGALSHLTMQAGQAAGGSKEAHKKFKELGIGLTDVSGNLKPTEVLFREAADAIAQTENPTLKASRAIGIFGRDGARLIPLLNGGSKGLDRFGAELEALGGVVPHEFIQEANDFQDGLTRLNAALFGFKAAVVHAILPLFKNDFLTGAVAGVNRLLKHTEYLRTAFVVLGGAAVLLGIKMLLPFIPSLLAALAFGAAIAFVIGVVEDLYMFFTGGESLVGRALAKMGITARDLAPLFEKLRTVAGNLWDALHSKIEAFLSGPSPRLEAFFARLKPLAEKALDWINSKLDGLMDIDWGARIDKFGHALGDMIDRVETFIENPAVKQLLNALTGSAASIAGGVGGGVVGGKIGSAIGGFLPGPLGLLAPLLGTAGGAYLGSKFLGGMFGGGSTPAVMPPSTNASGPMSHNVTNTVNVQVDGAGGDPHAIGLAVRRHVDAALQADREQTYSALVPAAR